MRFYLFIMLKSSLSSSLDVCCTFVCVGEQHSLVWNIIKTIHMGNTIHT